MSKKAIQKYLLYGELVCVLLMSCFFAYRILTFSNSEPIKTESMRFMLLLDI